MQKIEKVEFKFEEPLTLASYTLFEAKRFQDDQGRESGDPKFSVYAVIDPSSTALQKALAIIAQMATQAWPGRDPNTLQFCIQSGAKFADEGKLKGKDREAYRPYFVLKARSKYPPVLSVTRNGQALDVPAASVSKTPDGKGIITTANPLAVPYHADFYSGVLVGIQVKFDAHEVGNNQPGVNAYLDRVHSFGIGEKRPDFGSGETAQQAWGGMVQRHVGHVSGVDPTAAGHPYAPNGVGNAAPPPIQW